MRVSPQDANADEAELFGLLDDLDRQVRPVYEAYKTGLDADLSARFAIAAQDLRPWHYSDPFFQEAPAGDPAVRARRASAAPMPTRTPCSWPAASTRP